MGKKARVHIKVNSGMNRLGFLPTEESADAVARCMQLKNLDVTGIFTHLATADETDKSGARMQMRRFDAFLAMLKARGICMPTVHCGASPTICDLPEFYRDMVRPGLLLTGWYASDEVSRERIKLQPCVKLKARLGNVMPVKAGEGVGYGFTYSSAGEYARRRAAARFFRWVHPRVFQQLLRHDPRPPLRGDRQHLHGSLHDRPVQRS